MSRIRREDLSQDAIQALRASLREAGMDASPSGSEDLTLRWPGRPQILHILAASIVDEKRLASIIELGRAEHSPILVADRILGDAAGRLEQQGIGYLDRHRGHLHIAANGVRIDRDDLTPTPRARTRPPKVLAGQVALAVAVELLMNPVSHRGVRELARAVGASASTVQVSLRRMKEAAIVEDDGRPLIPELFWAVVEEWRPQRCYVRHTPNRTDGLPGEGQSYVLCSDAAASAWGALVPRVHDAPPDFYVPAGELQKDLIRLGPAGFDDAEATIAAAPCSPVISAAARSGGRCCAVPWPIVHPVVAALDLAQDRSRGREILADWTPSEEFVRVW